MLTRCAAWKAFPLPPLPSLCLLLTIFSFCHLKCSQLLLLLLLMLLLLLLLLFGPPAGSWAEAGFDAFSPTRHDFPYCFPCSAHVSFLATAQKVVNEQPKMLWSNCLVIGKCQQWKILKGKRRGRSSRSGRNCLPHTCTWAGLPCLFASCSLSAFDLLQLPTAGSSALCPLYPPHPLSLFFPPTVPADAAGSNNFVGVGVACKVFCPNKL